MSETIAVESEANSALRAEIPCYTTMCRSIPPTAAPPCDQTARWLVYLRGRVFPTLGCSTCMERWICWGSVDHVEPLMP